METEKKLVILVDDNPANLRIEIIIQGSGTQFNPTLVDVFLRTAEQFKT
jgi:response regulator RpfG family c-di-GMP phosphodiesterase